jgi:hypothetical protein
MGCSSCEMRKLYPDTVHAIFVSSTGNPIANTHAGIRAEIEALGTATLEPVKRVLRPITNINYLKESERLYLNTISFYGYDPLMLTPASPQDSDVVDDIYASKATNKILAQSQFQNGMLPINWLDNYCNPVFRIDGTNYLPGLNTVENDNTIINSAIGIELPSCFSIEKELDTNNIATIDIQAALAQYNSTEAKFQNYIIKAVAEFWVGKGYGKSNNN